MQIEIKDIEYCRVSASFEDDIEHVENKREEVIELFRKEPIPGYRKNRAPSDVVKYHYRDKIEGVLRHELAQDAFQTVINEKQLRPFGKPQFLSINLSGSRFKCEFCFNKLPEFELNQYKEFQIPKPVMMNAVEGTEKLLQELRVQAGEMVPFQENHFLEIDNSAIIDYTIIDNQLQKILKEVKGELFIVGKSIIKPFNDNLLGMQIDETREFTDTITDNADPLFLNKELKFIVKLVMASKSIPAPLDESLAIKLGFENLDLLKQEVQGIADARLQELEQQQLIQQITARLIREHKFEIPIWLSTFEAKILAKNNKEDWDQLSDEKKAIYLKQADDSVRISLILDKVKNIEPEAQLTDEEVVQIIKLNYNKFVEQRPSQNPEEVFKNLMNSEYLPVLFARIRDEFTLNFILKHSALVE